MRRRHPWKRPDPDDLPEPERVELREVHGQLVPVKVYKPAMAAGASTQTGAVKASRSHLAPSMLHFRQEPRESVSDLLDREYEGAAMARRCGKDPNGKAKPNR